MQILVIVFNVDLRRIHAFPKEIYILSWQMHILIYIHIYYNRLLMMFVQLIPWLFLSCYYFCFQLSLVNTIPIDHRYGSTNSVEIWGFIMSSSSTKNKCECIYFCMLHSFFFTCSEFSACVTCIMPPRSPICLKVLQEIYPFIPLLTSTILVKQFFLFMSFSIDIEQYEMVTICLCVLYIRFCGVQYCFSVMMDQ